MSDFYARMRKTASRLLRGYGCRITARRVLPGVYNPASGRRTEDTVLEWRPLAIRTAVSHEYLAGSGFGGTAGSSAVSAGSGGSRIRSGEMQLLIDCAATPFSPVQPQDQQAVQRQAAYRPQVGDLVIFPDGGRWVIVREQPVEPGGEPVFYRGIIRRE
ncbi:MAG: hypothetical protein LBV80_10965 [Deltaproteobacteria bacterium]|jgi:hypothetical protein|nr:hypothetical protein [Deltaproteobacteria bacterium]